MCRRLFLFWGNENLHTFDVNLISVAQVRLINGSGRTVSAGELVRLDIHNRNLFVVAQLTEFGIIGSVASASIPNAQYGMINLIGTVNWSNVIGPPVFPTTLDIANKVDKVTGKGLSTNDYSSEEKGKLDGLPRITISDVAPENPNANDIWIDSSQN